MIKVLIVEDEIHIARHLHKQVSKVLKETAHHINRMGTLEEAMQYLEKNEVDVLLLDLNLRGRDGFEVLKTLTAAPFYTIVVSAYKNRAIEAFEYGVADFVPKPFTEERLKKAFSRISGLEQAPEYPVKYFATQKKGKIQLVKDQDIAYIQAFGHYSKLHLKDGSTELHSKSLVKLSPLLSRDYERVHKSYLVKMSEVKNILVYEGGKYEIELKNGAFIPLGRSKYKKIKAKWLK